MSEITLVGLNTYDGILRWAIVLILVGLVILFFAKRKKLDSNRPWVATLLAALIVAPILLIEAMTATTPEAPVARRDDTPTPVKPEPEPEVEPEPEPEPEPEVEPEPDFIPVVPESDNNRSVHNVPSKDIVKPSGNSEKKGTEVTVLADYKVVHEKMNTDGKTFVIDKVENATATEGEIVTPEVEEYEGFVAPEPKTVEVAADKIVMIEYRYAREEHELKVYNEKYVNGAKSGKYYYGTEFSLDAMERPGYNFAGWSDMTQTAQTEFTLKSDKVIGPNYLPKAYVVEFHANDARATGEMATQEFVYDESEALNANQFVIQGYFMRWNTQADGQGDYYDDGQTVKNLSTGEKVDLYAIWIPRDDTPYRVIHRKMTPNGDYINAEEEVEDLTGETDSSVTPDTKEYPGFEAPEKHTETISGDGSTVVIYDYARKKFTLRLGELSHIDAADREKNGNEYYFGATIELTAEAAFDGAVFDKWNDGATERVRTVVMPSNDLILYPLYTGDGDFPVVFEQQGQCQFNGHLAPTVSTAMNSADNMTGDDCLRFMDTKFIDTGVQLFSADNIGKDFLISFTIDEFDMNLNSYRPTLLNATEEDEAVMWAGLVLRRNDTKNEFQFGNNITYMKPNGSYSRINKKVSEAQGAPKQVMIYRKSGAMYFKTTDASGNWKASKDLGNQNNIGNGNTLYAHDTPLYFGASREKVNNVWKPTKFMNAKLSNIVVRLGTDVDGLIPNN